MARQFPGLCVFCDDGRGGVFVVLRRDQRFNTIARLTADGERTCSLCIGEKSAQKKRRDDTKVTDSRKNLNMMDQKHFNRKGTGNQHGLGLAFENGYTDGFQDKHIRVSSFDLKDFERPFLRQCSSFAPMTKLIAF